MNSLQKMPFNLALGNITLNTRSFKSAKNVTLQDDGDHNT